MSASSSATRPVIWLTRPRNQADDLARALRERGADVLSLPMLTIQPVEPDRASHNAILDLDHYHMVVFVSTNAVHHGLDRIHDYWPQYPVGILNLAVGPTTAAALEESGLAARYPEQRMDSEGLLALPELRDIAGKKALIVRGEGGREVLASALRERGCRVDYAEVYRRARPVYEASFLRQCVDRQPPAAVVISSLEALDNFVALLEPVWPGLRRTRLFLPSSRLVAAARERGFTQVVEMAGPNDAAIVAAWESECDEDNGR